MTRALVFPAPFFEASSSTARTARRLVFAGTFFALQGCATEVLPPSAPAVVFPTRAEIQRIPGKAPLPQAFGTTDVPVEEWSVESLPLPAVGPYEDPSAWGALANDLVKPRAASVTLSPALRCTAAEIARFHLTNRALPVEGLRRFMLARCGGEAPNLAPVVWFVDAPPSVSDAQIAARAREALANLIEEPLAHGHHLVGLAAARDGKHAVVALVIAEDEARLEPGGRSVDAGRHVTLKGTARGEYAAIAALVNRGDFGFSRCDLDARVRAPAFSVTCELAPGDSFAWVEVLGQKRGHVMLQPLADLLAYEGDGSAVRYRAKSYGGPATVTTPASFTGALVERLNAVRGAAKMAPLALEAKQSVENERLAGTILDATLVHDDDSSEKATLGLLAGWDVEGGMIRGGQFFIGTAAPATDAGAWLEVALERPIGRLTLLDPDARSIAVGPTLLPGAPGLGAVVTTYSLFTSDNHTADEALVLRRIQAARVARGLPPAQPFRPSDDMRQLAVKVEHEGKVPRGALNEMLASLAWTTGGPAYGYVFETNDLENMQVPEELLRQGPSPLVLAITHHRAPGAAWGQYVVFALLPGGRAAMEATREGRSRIF